MTDFDLTDDTEFYRCPYGGFQLQRAVGCKPGCPLMAQMNQMLPLQNMLVSAFNMAIMACVPANQAAIQLSCDNSAKQMSFYLSNYVGKDSNALKATDSMLLAAMNHIKLHPSNVPDAGSASRTAAHLLTNTCNRVVGAGDMMNVDEMGVDAAPHPRRGSAHQASNGRSAQVDHMLMLRLMMLMTCRG